MCKQLNDLGLINLKEKVPRAWETGQKGLKNILGMQDNASYMQLDEFLMIKRNIEPYNAK